MLEIDSKILKKLTKKYPTKYENEKDIWTDESKCFGFCRTNEYILKRKDWNKGSRRKTTLQEIREAIELSEKLGLIEFFLKEDGVYSIGNMELILEDIPEETIKEITVEDKSVLIIETTFGFFVLPCWISCKSYTEFQKLVAEKKKFFGKVCDECGKPATVYDYFTGLFWCQTHSPEETIYNDFYLENLESGW